MKCNLCPRNCNVDRSNSFGYCGMSDEIKAARAALHMWEEPCISGKTGSGAVFFSGCQLRCVFCQNHNIAEGKAGLGITEDELVDIFLNLQSQGAANINLVSATHFVPQIIPAIKKARKLGLEIPFVYNTSSYDNVSTIEMLDGLVDIFLPDLKYFSPEYSKRYSNASDYFDKASKAIDKMVEISGAPIIESGLMKKGTIVRHLLLPGLLSDSKKIIEYLYKTYSDNIYISIMNQYTPLEYVEKYPEINRKVTTYEYNKLVDFAIDLGIKMGFTQDKSTQTSSFIPEFDYTGIKNFENIEK